MKNRQKSTTATIGQQLRWRRSYKVKAILLSAGGVITALLLLIFFI